MAAALFCSGAAALINQAVWQRSLTIYLAGCEAISAMIVVLTFMLGLGLGSLYIGRNAEKIRDPLRALGLVELSLFAINLAIAFLLSLDIAESIYSFQRVALSVGVPLRLVYALSATAVLLPPCFLMGMTMPLASDAYQRQLGETDSRRLPFLVFLNTLGAVLGVLASGFLLMPFLGQQMALLLGASFSCLAGLIVLGLRYARSLRPAPLPEMVESGATGDMRRGRFSREEVMGFWLGFLSLAYEMYLFRIVSLAHEPRPYNFSIVLCYYLLFWSIGVALAGRFRLGTTSLLAVSGLLVVLAPWYYGVDRWMLRPEGGVYTILASAAVYCLPCISFGLLFGNILASAAKRWGNDVGRLIGLNTLGSCLGILASTLVGYEVNYLLTTIVIAGGYVLLLVYWRRKGGASVEGMPKRVLAAVAVGACLVAGVSN